MADSEQVVDNVTASNMIEQLGKTLHELKAFKDASEDRVQWTEVEEHFRNLEAVLKGKYEELEAREKEYEEKEAETRALLAEREAAVVAEEQDLLDRIQVLKDAAVSAIAEARANHKPIQLESTDGVDSKDSKDLRRNSQGKSGSYGGATGAQSDVNALELAALRAVIRCVEDYKLETDYPLDPLQKRLSQLERSKYDKKRAGGGDYGRQHHQAKKSKPNRDRGRRGFRGGGAPPVAAGGWQASPAFIERTPYHGLPDRYAHPAASPYEYQVPSHSAVYGQQTVDQRMYYNPQDDRTTPGSYSAVPGNYGGYVGNGTRSTRQPYM